MKLNIKHGFILLAIVTSQLLYAQNKTTNPKTVVTKNIAKDTAGKDCCSKNIPRSSDMTPRRRSQKFLHLGGTQSAFEKISTHSLSCEVL